MIGAYDGEDRGVNATRLLLMWKSQRRKVGGALVLSRLTFCTRISGATAFYSNAGEVSSLSRLLSNVVLQALNGYHVNGFRNRFRTIVLPGF